MSNWFDYSQLWLRGHGLLERQIIAADYYLNRTVNPPTLLNYNKAGMRRNNTVAFTPGVLPYSLNDVIAGVPNKDGLYDVTFYHPLDYKFRNLTYKQNMMFEMSLTVLDDGGTGKKNYTVKLHNLYGPAMVKVTREPGKQDTVFPYSYSSTYRIYGWQATISDLKEIHAFAQKHSISIPLATLIVYGMKVKDITPAQVKELDDFFRKIVKENLFRINQKTSILPYVDKGIMKAFYEKSRTFPEKLRNHIYGIPSRQHSFDQVIRFFLFDEIKASKINAITYS